MSVLVLMHKGPEQVVKGRFHRVAIVRSTVLHVELSKRLAAHKCGNIQPHTEPPKNEPYLGKRRLWGFDN